MVSRLPVIDQNGRDTFIIENGVRLNTATTKGSKKASNDRLTSYKTFGGEHLTPLGGGFFTTADARHSYKLR